MKLDEDGTYYFDIYPKKELQYDLYKKIIDELMDENDCIHIENISGTKFCFEFSDNLTFIYKVSEPNNRTGLSNFPPQVTFKIIKDNNEITYKNYIYSLEQYDKILKNYGINFPWSRNFVLDEDNLELLIYHSAILNKSVIIEDVNIFNTINISEEKENESIFKFKQNIKSLKDLSLYINLYLKNDINLSKYEENEFIKEKDFTLDINSNFIAYDKRSRLQYWTYFEKMTKKDYFFTGPYSIGKTFTLLSFANYNKKNVRKAYFNLEILKSEKQYFEIIAYESRNLFDNNESWKNTFLQIKKERNSKVIDIIIFLIRLASSKIGQKYIFILDQIKFQSINEDDVEFEQIKSIRKEIAITNNCFLIGCFSINYKGVKDLLFNQWFSIGIAPIQLEYFKKMLKYEEEDEILDQENDEETEKNRLKNKLLKMLGNLPRYINIKNALNKKLLNVIIKKIKDKIQNFYNKDKLLSLYKLKEIQVNKPFINIRDFKTFLEKIPFKYFTIDNEEYKIDYAYPLVKKAIEELLYTYELDNYNPKSPPEIGWQFERRVIDKIKTTHIFGKYYIDDYFEIPTIYRKYKIQDELFYKKENILFYFSYVNVRRYDFAIYIYESKSLILGQASIKKEKKQLNKYISENFKKDIDDMQKFLKVNDLEVNNYFLIFALDYENYTKEENYNLIQSYNFKYCLYNYKKNCFEDDMDIDIDNLYQINYKEDINLIISDNEEELFEFGIKDNSFIYGKEIKKFKYYTEKGTLLSDFLEETMDENIIEIFNQSFKYNAKKFYLSKITMLMGKVYKEDYCESEDETSIVFLKLEKGILYIGTGIIENGKCELSFICKDCFSSFNNSISDKNIDFKTGFIFKSQGFIKFYK